MNSIVFNSIYITNKLSRKLNEFLLPIDFIYRVITFIDLDFEIQLWLNR